LAKRLIGFDSSEPAGIRACTEYLTGWLEARDIAFSTFDVDEVPVLTASVGEGPVTIVLLGHTDVVPGDASQFIPHVDDEYLWGRGSYDMKGADAVMLSVLADLASLETPLPVGVKLVLAPDEESDREQEQYGTAVAVRRGHVGDFVVCGEPTDLHIGVQAKGVLDLRIDVDGRSAHGATPWLGVNAIVRAIDVYERLERLPFAQESSRFFDRPSINLGRIRGGGRLNLVPDRCTIEVDIRYLPEQPVERIREEIATLPGCRVHELHNRLPARVSTSNAFVGILHDVVGGFRDGEVQFVGRDGTNDGVNYLMRGIPSVEFGPAGAGHHGPQERVSIRSMRQYRLALLGFLHAVAHAGEDLAGLTIPTHPSGSSERRADID
jgi:succinyl-diaminopimelate desuccinylase